MSKVNLQSTRWTASAAAALATLAAAASAGAAPLSTPSGVQPMDTYNPPIAVANTQGNEALVQSTGNLYWTADSGTSCAPHCSASVYRTAKNSSPSRAIPLYSLKSTTPIEFGDVAYAEIGGNYYGYFVVNKPSTRTSQIEQIPLTGSATATPVATAPSYIGNDDLVTDGTALYWGSAGGIKRLVIGSTSIQKLGSTASAHLRVVGTRLYFSDGADLDVTNTTGGAIKTLYAAEAPITALDVAATAHAGTEVAFGDSQGNLYVQTGEMSAPAEVGYTLDGSPITSMSVDAADGDIGLTVDAPSFSAVCDLAISPSGSMSILDENETAPGAGSAQIDDANTNGDGNYVYYAMSDEIDKIQP